MRPTSGLWVRRVVGAAGSGWFLAGVVAFAGAAPKHEQYLLDVAVSPDGRHVAFTRYDFTGAYDDDHNSVWVADRDGSHARRVLPRAAYATFSPDAERIAAGMRIDGDWEIVTARLDGSDLRRLTTRPGDDDVPSWSVDGKTVYFTSKLDGNADLYSMPSAGGVTKHLTSGPDGDYNPQPSPDGKTLVFYRERGDRRDQVWTLDLASGRETRLTDGTGHNIFPAYLADGSIGWSSLSDGGERRLVVRSAPGGAAKPVGPPGVFMARWPADGKEITYFVRPSGEGTLDLLIRRMTREGRDSHVVLDVAALEEPR